MNLKSCALFVLLFALSGAASADAGRHNHRSLPPVAGKKMVAKKKATLKLYPNPSTNGTVRVVSNMAGKLHFYVFDLEGTMLHRAVIAGRGRHTITNLNKGIYTYDAFYNDEGIEHGTLTVK
jgi:hypothetical protein